MWEEGSQSEKLPKEEIVKYNPLGCLKNNLRYGDISVVLPATPGPQIAAGPLFVCLWVPRALQHVSYPSPSLSVTTEKHRALNAPMAQMLLP